LHVAAWHCPAAHEVAHATHAAPPVPHAPVVFPASQVVPLQHPVGHVAGEHIVDATHVPVALHVSLSASQFVHAAPPFPHAFGAVPT
jgi:hypothetical protein